MLKNNNCMLLFLIGIFFLLQIPLIDKVPRIMLDEPWYANTGWNFSIGNGFTNTVPGSQGGDYLFLFTFLLGIAFKLFDASLLTARMVSVIGGLLGLLGFIWVLKELKIKSNLVIILCSFLFIFSNVNYIIFRSVRPESWVVALGLWALYFLIKAYKDENNVNYFIGGLFSFASFLCHPNGAIYVLLFGIIILVISYTQKNFFPVLFFIIGNALMSIILLYNILYIRQETPLEFFNELVQQGNRLSISNGILTGLLININTFFITYTLGIKRLFIIIFELGVLSYGLFYIKKNKYIFAISVLGLSYFIIAMVFLSPFSARGFSEVLIFSFITFAILLDYHGVYNKNIYKYFVTAGILYLGNNITGDLYLIWRDKNNTSYSTIEKRIEKIIPSDNNVLTFLNFWFPLKYSNNYNDFTRWNKTEYENLDDFIINGETDFVVISDYLAQGKTSVSGRPEPRLNFQTEFYNKLQNYAKKNGKLIELLKTKGYSDIQIWKIQGYRNL